MYIKKDKKLDIEKIDRRLLKKELQFQRTNSTEPILIASIL